MSDLLFFGVTEDLLRRAENSDAAAAESFAHEVCLENGLDEKILSADRGFGGFRYMIAEGIRAFR